MTENPRPICHFPKCKRLAYVEYDGALYCAEHDMNVCAGTSCILPAEIDHMGLRWCKRHHPPTLLLRCRAVFKPYTLHA